VLLYLYTTQFFNYTIGLQMKYYFLTFFLFSKSRLGSYRPRDPIEGYMHTHTPKWLMIQDFWKLPFYLVGF